MSGGKQFRSHPGGAGARIKGSYSEHHGIGAAREGDFMPDPDQGVRDRYRGVGAHVGGSCIPEPAVHFEGGRAGLGKSDSLLAIAQRPHIRPEKAEERLCDEFIARKTGRESVVRFSQPRQTMQTLGIPDRRYYAAGLVFWWDVKKADGRLRAEQIEFMEREAVYGQIAACGTLEDLVAFVNALTDAFPSERESLAITRARELRKKYTRKARKAKRGKV